MSKIEIRIAALSDLESLQLIGKQTFTETFAAVNTAKNLSNYIAQSFNAQQVTKELTNPDSSFYLAIFDAKIIGYLKINFGSAQTELMNEHAMEIHRIYVLQEYHGEKVGQLFIDQVLEIAHQRQVEYIWLGVWEENYRALGFYAKNGFVEFDKHVFTLGDDIQTDLLLKLQIKK
ncbi:GNAT family N-acetyltransferase [Flavobacterium frigoris]|nr:GNAT family N-acetyltransferase [Flavobacterium frigoris]